ncbi:MAG: hypothetical protein JWP74_2063 [Marmoricola sp.]|nr:hypothetical protein [Marmoricola sp.]
MKFKSLIVSLFVIGVGLVGPGAAASFADGAHQAAPAHSMRACTKTSSGKCIRGGEFCPKAKYNKNGYDSKGRRYVCKGSRSHPHWEKP